MAELLPADALLVEDNSADAELTMMSLRRQRNVLQIEWAKDGVEALDYLFCRARFASRDPVPPRLILLDLKLPKVDGLEVLREVKADQRLHNVPVVMFTSSAEEGDLVKSYTLGVNSYVVKPVDFDAFSDEVSKLGGYWLQINRVPKY